MAASCLAIGMADSGTARTPTLDRRDWPRKSSGTFVQTSRQGIGCDWPTRTCLGRQRRGGVVDIRLKLCSSLLAILFGLTALVTPWTARAGDVWVNTSSGVYHCPGTQYYGNTKRGEHLTESAAITRGYRPAYNRPCSPSEVSRTRKRLIQDLAPTDTSQNHKVWINPGSHVYHCPGTRYYGATKRGYFATEGEATSRGNRPAYGARCN